MDNRLKKQFLSLMGRMDNRMTLNEAQEFTSKIILNEQKKGYQKIVGSFMEVLGKSGKNISNYLDDVQIKYNSFLDDVLKKFDEASMLYKSTDDLITSLKSLPTSTTIKRYFNELEKSMINSLENIAKSNGELNILEQAKKVMSGGAIPKDIPIESLKPYLESLKNIENIKIHNKVLSIIGDMGESIKRGDTDILSIFTNSLLKNNPDLSVKNIMSDIDNLKVFSKESDDFLNDIFERIDDLGTGLKNEDDILETLGKSFDNTYKFKEGFFKRMLTPKKIYTKKFNELFEKIDKLDVNNSIIVKTKNSNGEDVITFIEVKNPTPEKIKAIKNKLMSSKIEDISDEVSKGISKSFKEYLWKYKYKWWVLLAVDFIIISPIINKIKCSFKGGDKYYGDDKTQKTLEEMEGVSPVKKEDVCNLTFFNEGVVGHVLWGLSKVSGFEETLDELGDTFKGLLKTLEVSIRNKIDDKLGCCYKLSKVVDGKLTGGCDEKCDSGCSDGNCDGLYEEIKEGEDYKNVEKWIDGDSGFMTILSSWLKAGESIEKKKEKILSNFRNDGILPEEMFKDGALNVKEFTTNLCGLSKRMSNVCRVQQIMRNWNEWVDQDLTEETCNTSKHIQLFKEQKEMAKYLDNDLIVDGSVTQEDLSNVKNVGDLIDKIKIPLEAAEKNSDGNMENNDIALDIIKKNMKFIGNKEKYCICLKNPDSEGCPKVDVKNEGEGNTEDGLIPVKKYIDEVIVNEFTQGTCQAAYSGDDGVIERQKSYYKTYLTNAGYSETDVKDGLEYIFNVKIPEYCNK